MKIKIGEYTLLSDSLNFILTREGIGKSGKSKGKIVERERFHFASINQALNHILHSRLLESDATTLKELKTELTDTKEWLKRLFEEVI